MICGKSILSYVNLVIEKKLNIWNEVLEKAYSENRKELLAFVSRRTKSRKWAISALRNNAGVSESLSGSRF